MHHLLIPQQYLIPLHNQSYCLYTKQGTIGKENLIHYSIKHNSPEKKVRTGLKQVSCTYFFILLYFMQKMFSQKIDTKNRVISKFNKNCFLTPCISMVLKSTAKSISFSTPLIFREEYEPLKSKPMCGGIRAALITTIHKPFCNLEVSVFLLISIE